MIVPKDSSDQTLAILAAERRSQRGPEGEIGKCDFGMMLALRIEGVVVVDSRVGGIDHARLYGQRRVRRDVDEGERGWEVAVLGFESIGGGVDPLRRNAGSVFG